MSGAAVLRRHRGVSALTRALAYGVAGCAMEATFTSLVASRAAKRPVLRGPSTPWMLPIYALAQPLYEPVHEALRARPSWQRGAVYATGIFAVEAATGEALRRLTGQCPWDYTGRSPLSIRGVIRLDYAPLWALAGLAAERLHDALVDERTRHQGADRSGDGGLARPASVAAAAAVVDSGVRVRMPA